VTLTVYAHVLPGDQKRAASRFALSWSGGVMALWVRLDFQPNFR
jgi:hypothetical protein